MIRLMGSQFFSTRILWPGSAFMGASFGGTDSESGFVAACERGAAATPLRLLIGSFVRDAAQGPDHRSVDIAHEHGGKLPAGRLIHKRHELVREAGHGASDADPADIGA